MDTATKSNSETDEAAASHEDEQPMEINATDVVNDSLTLGVDQELLSGVFSNKTDGGVADKVGTSSPLSRKLMAPLMAAAPSLTVQASPTGSRAGTAYAVLDSAGTLTLFRSTNTYTAGTGKTVTDIMGNTYTGRVYTDVESVWEHFEDSAPWYNQRRSVKYVRTAEGQVIVPNDMSYMFWECSSIISLDVSGWDFSKVTSSSNYLGLQSCSALRELKVSATAKLAGLSEHSAQGDYGTTWKNVEKGITGSTAANLVTTVNAGNGAGTWTWEKLDPRAGTAYAVLDSAGTLTLFRSTNTYTAGTNQTVTDIAGNTYTGQVYTGIENTATDYNTEPWYSQAAPWYSQRLNVRLARIADGQIIAPKSCAGWFYYCSNMTAFEGAERLDTSAVTTMYSMFAVCRAMTEPPAVGGWNTSSVINMDAMFEDCSITEPPAVGNWDTSAVTSMQRMFNSCSSMTEPPAVDDWDTSAVTDIGDMFSYCSAMTRPPAVGKWNTSAVTDMYCMFQECKAMTEPPAVGGWNTSAVIRMYYMFSNCLSMANPPAVGNWNTGSVDDMDYMFDGCSAMSEPPAVGNWNTSKVTDMSGMFNGCSAMTESPVVGSWDTSKATTIENMFSGCSSIAEPPAVNNWNTSTVLSMYEMFKGCSKMASLDVSGWDFTKVTSSWNYLGLQNCSALRELKVPAGAKIDGLPEHTAQGDYVETWGNVERGITGSTAANLISTVNAGNGAGTWTWDLAGYTVSFIVDGSGTAMQSERVKADEDYVVPSCEVTKLYHDFVEWSGSDGKTYHESDTIPAGTFSAGETLTLTAVFEPHEYGPGELEGNIQITIPSSINFVVEPDGTLTGPSNVSIENNSPFSARISSVDVNESSNFKFVASTDDTDEPNAVELRFGPIANMLSASSFLSKGSVPSQSAWAMGHSDGQNTIQLKTEGRVSRVDSDITRISKFGEIRWYVKAGE